MLNMLQKQQVVPFIEEEKYHTIRKCKKMAGQNTFPILLLNDANMIGEVTRTLGPGMV